MHGMRLWPELQVPERRKVTCLIVLAQFDPKACVRTAVRTHRAELRRVVRARGPYADLDDVLQIGALHATA